METDMEQQGGRKRQEKEGNGSDACYLDVDAGGEKCPKKARKELEENISAEHEDVISQLPDLVQDRIFSLLDVRDKVQAAQVGSSWRNAVYRPCQWREVKVRVKLCKLPEEALISFKERKIRHLKVDHFLVKSNALDMLHDCLVSLDLSETLLPLSSLQRVFCKSFISLKKLCVFMNSAKPLGFQRVQHVFGNLPNLEDLNLHEARGMNVALKALRGCLKSLKRFSLLGCGETPCNLKFLDQFSSLQSLNFRGVTLRGLNCLKSSCKGLKQVSFKHCDFDSDRWPEVLCQLSSLEELKVDHCFPAVEDGFRLLAQGQRNLKVLMYDLCFLSPFVLDLWSVAQMPNLETLSVSCCNLPNDADLRALSSGLENLKSLAITGCENFSALMMKGIAGLSSLQELSLKEIRGVDGTALEILSSSSCQLRKLELRGCRGIRGEDMKHVAGMSSLRDLTLCYLNLDLAGLKYLKQGTLRLEALKIDDCGWIFKDVRPWLVRQQSLQRLQYWTYAITEAERIEAQNLRKLLPSLKDVVLTPS